VRKVRQLYGMLEGTTCRAAAVRRYFGEEGAEPCGVCDLCLNPVEGVDSTQAAQKALSAAHRLNGRTGRGRIVDHLLGKTKEVSSYEAGLSTFGVGQELKPAAWRDLIDQLLFEGLLVEDPNDGRPLIGLGEPEAVRAVYRGERRVITRRALTDRREARAPRRARGSEALAPADLPLFEALRAWRRDEAARQAVPPYVIFADRTLVELARDRPATPEALLRVNGVGQAKLERYGAAVLAVLGNSLR
jgi:ATP-dependent DNA helicase RecQ